MRWGTLTSPLWLWKDGTISQAVNVSEDFPNGTPGLYQDFSTVIPVGTILLVTNSSGESSRSAGRGGVRANRRRSSA